MPQPQLLMDAWRDFRAAVVPRNASPLQVEVVRQAFFGGALVLLKIVERLHFDDVTPAEREAVMRGVADEATAFIHEQFSDGRRES